VFVFTFLTQLQVVTGSMDSTIRTWDLAKGTTINVLTHHKKSVRALALHPSEPMMVSASPDNIKQWQLPETKFLKNLSGHSTIIHTLSVNKDNVLVSGGDNGSLYFWDWKSGYNFQKIQTTVQPGSLESEAGIFASAFDMTGSRLITCEADKTIKVYKEDDNATPETHPIDKNWRPTKQIRYN
jgi:pleiotropic regulator 1